MARVYATEADYTAYTGETPPANIDRLLRIASGVVDYLLTGRLYDVDTSGMPTAVADSDALRDATCVIAQDADAANLIGSGGSQEWGSVSIGNVSLSNPLGGSSTHRTVSGVPVPAEALILLADVGSQWVFVR